MSQLLKVEGESVWINVDRVDGVMVRPQLHPQLRAVGEAHGQGTLEERHEGTGLFELAAYFHGQRRPVPTFPPREAAEEAGHQLIGARMIRDL